MTKEELFEHAARAAQKSYSPYSRFRVGAALLAKDGTLFYGTNIENRSFGLTSCAERNALFTAISKGVKDFEAIAVYCSDADYPVSPCGACRQVLSEFVGGNFILHFRGKTGETLTRRMAELLPDDALYELKDRS